MAAVTPTYCRHCGDLLKPGLAPMGICTECVGEAAARNPTVTYYPTPRAPKRLPKVSEWKPSKTSSANSR